ncbi:MAG: YciI family protein [Acidobacteriaceae bacterium]|nr:YciI family protein [Acidobacteriaceae bacterium]
MKYLCMVFIDERKLEALSESEAAALNEESLAYDEALRRNGNLIAAQALQAAQSAKTVRTRQGKVLVTDGPFAETREQVGGFILIEAEDLNEAVQLASKIPVMRLGDIEIRPVKELTGNSRRSMS